MFVEGTEGVGRSRLLEEMTLMARVAGALVIAAQGASADRPYRLACDLAHAFCERSPKKRGDLAQPHADVLGTTFA